MSAAILAAGKYSGGGGFVIVGVGVQYAAYRFYLWQGRKNSGAPHTAQDDQ